MDRGELVPDDLTIDMVMDRWRNPTAKGAILDGFPRTLPQASARDKALAGAATGCDWPRCWK